ncbi:MAG: glycerate kinase [Planctomycetes bacterium]|nr:glycerate kinase [Planctomycetota bacterium]
MKFVCAPDKFKLACSAEQAAQALAAGVREALPGAEIEQLPLADGGEGTLSVLAAAFPHRVKARVKDALGRDVDAEYALNADRTSVLIESAQSCGLFRLQEFERNPGETNTFGVGQLIAHALEHKPREILVGLGGSATSDAGMGMAVALGAKFSDADGKPVEPKGDLLTRVSNIDLSKLDPRLKDVKVRGVCDVQTPLLGPGGASRKYVLQKGGTTRMVHKLEQGLAVLAAACVKHLAFGDPMAAGSGSAGGLGFGIATFLGGRLEHGARTVLQLLEFERRIKGAACVLTGEGSYDALTADGKLVSEIASVCKHARVPCVVLAGKIDPAVEIDGVTAAFEIAGFGMRRQDALAATPESLTRYARHVARLIAR